MPSLRRAAMTDIATEDVIARVPAAPTTAMWTPALNITMCIPDTARSTAGITPARAKTPTTVVVGGSDLRPGFRGISWHP